MDIRKKMAKGAFWLFLEKGAQQLSSFVVFAVIARMIGPEEYGLVALCGIVLTLMNNVTSGMVDAVISMRIRDDERLSSLFWTVTAGGAILSLVSFLFAHPFALLFDQEKLAPLLQAFSIMPFLFALAAVPTALITATMDFKVFTIRTLVASLVGGLAGIYCAMHGFGAFSLAIQQAVSQLAVVAVVWISSTWRPRLIFNVSALKEMLHLGMAQTGSLFVGFLDSQTPRFVLGYFLGPAAVGYYSFILRICGAIQDGVIQPVLNVVYPALSDIIDDHEKKKQVINQTIFIVGAVLFPLIVGLIVTAKDFVPIVFGDKWAQTVSGLQCFVPAIAALSINIVMRSVLRAHRCIWLYLRVQIMLVLLGILAAFAVVSYGLLYVIAVNAAMAFLLVTVSSSLVIRKLKIPVGSGLLSLWSPLASSLIMGGGVAALQGTLPQGVARLVMEIIVGGVAYIGIFSLIERKFIFRLVSKMRTSRQPI